MSAGQSLGDTRAYVLIDADPEMTDRVVESLRRRSDVLLADVINGPHNVIAVIEDRNASTLAAAILVSVRKLKGVRDLTVYLAMPWTGAKSGYVTEESPVQR